MEFFSTLGRVLIPRPHRPVIDPRDVTIGVLVAFLPLLTPVRTDQQITNNEKAKAGVVDK